MIQYPKIDILRYTKYIAINFHSMHICQSIDVNLFIPLAFTFFITDSRQTWIGVNKYILTGMLSVWGAARIFVWGAARIFLIRFLVTKIFKRFLVMYGNTLAQFKPMYS